MARYTPFHRSLIDPRLVFGVDRNAFVLMLLGNIALLMVLKSLWLLLVGVGMYVLLRVIFANDPHYMRIYANYSAEADRYEPFVRALPGRSGRRLGRGKGVLC